MEYATYEQYLKKSKITNYKFCKDNKIPFSTMSMWKHGKTKLKLETQLLIAQRLNIPTKVVLGTDSNKKIKNCG